MVDLFIIFIWLLVGYWGYWLAKKNGRSEVLALFACLLFGIFGIFVYYLLGKSEKKLKEEKEALKKEISDEIEAKHKINEA